MDQNAQCPLNDLDAFLTVVFTIGIGVIVASTEAGRWAHASAATRLTFDPTNMSLSGVLFGQLMIGILGVLVVSAEYGTGTIRASLAAVPNRRSSWRPKQRLLPSSRWLMGEFVSFVAFFTGQTLISGGAPHATLTHPVCCVPSSAAASTWPCWDCLAVGLGLIIRHTAGAIAAFVGVLLVLPLLSPAFPTSIQNAISKFEPTSIGDAMSVVEHPLPSGFGPVLQPMGRTGDLGCLRRSCAWGRRMETGTA